MGVLVVVGAMVGFFVWVATLTGGHSSLQQMAMDNISEARFFMRHAHSENLRVQFFSGVRESNYEIDGVAGGTTPFALLNVEPRNASHLDDSELRGTLQIGTETVEVTLERNEFGRNFAVDLGREVAADVDVLFTLLPVNANAVPFPLLPAMPEGSIDWKEALRIGTDYLAEAMANVTQFESYVKIITDRGNHSAFWFVQFITNNGENHFVVIAAGGEIIGGQQPASSVG